LDIEEFAGFYAEAKATSVFLNSLFTFISLFYDLGEFYEAANTVIEQYCTKRIHMHMCTI